MSTVRGAVTLLTRLPVGVVLSDGPGAAAFGLVGGLVGLVGAIPLVVASGPLAEPWLGAIGAVAAVVLVSGGMHLDGLADTADALNARDMAGAERARKDPALGPAGVIGIALVLAAEVAALGSLAGTVGAVVSGLVLVAVAATSRTLPVLTTRAAGRAATDGLGSWFADRVTTSAVLSSAGSAMLVVAGAAWLAGPAAWVIAAAAGGAAIFGAIAAAVIVERRGGLDGDGMGAIVELSVVGGLVGAALVAV